ncbi:hypothetical protein VQ7734_04429 [Vibrio quintilis]|uniref:Uncharacterized protein n=2 Tax=Vibrio quintilis TaxID=1117707 RepID=A0A1M7Z138_9VIBR|nr:hypothetical protein VQ7734_04429 [Vibrio quintilis]
MSIQSKIDCPDCGTPIHFESTLLLAGKKFSCPNPDCHTSISLAPSEVSTVSEAFGQFEKIRSTCIQQAEKTE